MDYVFPAVYLISQQHCYDKANEEKSACLIIVNFHNDFGLDTLKGIYPFYMFERVRCGCRSSSNYKTVNILKNILFL